MEIKFEKAGLCPVCGKENVEFSDIDINGEVAKQKCYCCDCGCEFEEIFTYFKKSIIN